MKKSLWIVLAVAVIAIAVCLIVCPRGAKDAKTQSKSVITVTIQPLKYLVDRITGNGIPVNVIVPPGSSPENYEPTPSQLIDIERSALVAATGLIDFEKELLDRILRTSGSRFANLSEGIKLIEGSCGHVHHNEHTHSVDPHIWTSPRQLKIMASNLFNAIALLYPDSVQYQNNYQRLIEDIDMLDIAIDEMVRASNVKYFFIYHPALTYYAEDYGMEQVALEHDGKEPSAERLSSLIKLAREQKIDKILYQREFSRATVETIARDINAIPVEIDPLAENVIDNILNITNIICDN